MVELEHNGGEPRDTGQLLASMQKDELRSLFYLFTGKPDSRIKVYDEPVHIKPEDIAELEQCVARKLATHNIEAVVTSVRIGYDGSQMNEFGTWAEFEAHHWQEPEKLEEVVVKWDFLVSIENFKVPQRHTLLFRVSRDIKPGQLLQMLASGNAEDLEPLDVAAAPAFCRVDFINAQISKELINVVTDWYEGRDCPKLIPDIWYWFKKRRNTVALLFDQWLVFSWAVLLAALGIWANSKYYGGNVPIGNAAVLLFLGMYSLRPIRRISHYFASRTFRALAELEGSRVVFEFTSGDKKRISKLEADNKKQGKAFVRSSLWNVGLNLVAAIIYGYLFVSAHP